MRSLLTSPVPSLAPWSAWLRLQQGTFCFRIAAQICAAQHQSFGEIWLQSPLQRGPQVRLVMTPPYRLRGCPADQRSPACQPHTDIPAWRYLVGGRWLAFSCLTHALCPAPCGRVSRWDWRGAKPSLRGLDGSACLVGCQIAISAAMPLTPAKKAVAS